MVDQKLNNSVAELFVDRVYETPDKPALGWIDGSGSSLQTRSWTWVELASRVAHYAAALADAGVDRGSHVVLISENRIEWIIADLSIQLLGAVNVPLHDQLTPKQALLLGEHCEADLILTANELQRRKFNDLSWQVPLFVFDNHAADKFCWQKRLNQVPPWSFSELANRSVHIEPDDLVSIIYTSGTTGEPKGVMLSHLNVHANVFSKLQTLPLGLSDVRLAILPFSHIFARVCDLYTWIAAGCELVLSRGWNEIFEDLQQVRPTYINAVPYFYEKCYRELHRKNQLDDPHALRSLLGGRTAVCNCGGGPLADHVFDYFQEKEVGLVTGYGLTETSPVVSSNRVGQCRRGSVGPAVPGVEISLAEDGEVLIRGENVMQGYYKDDLATRAALAGGWFHSGDIGKIDEDGFLYIVGRKKELIVTSGGKNIAPIPLENALNAHPAIEQSVVFGDRRIYLVALIVPNADWQSKNSHQAMREIIDEQLVDFSKYEQLGNFELLAQPFSIENGMLTAKKSLRRENIMTAYASTIDRLYDSTSLTNS